MTDDSVGVFVLYPTRETWAQGDRAITCIATLGPEADRVAQGAGRTTCRYLRYRLRMTSEQFDAVIVGAGFGGIGAAIQLKRLGYDDFVILEREDDLGGTWYVNHYPGLAVDVPTTTYSYFFEPNPNWSRLFTPGPEIKQYADDVADKYDVRRHMRFNTTVEGARWDEDAQRLAGRAGRRRDADHPLPDHRDRASCPSRRCPTSRASTTFEGKVIHTTEWDDDYRRRRAADRRHRHRRHRRAAHPRARQEGRRPHRLPAHPDLGGAEDRPALRRAGQAAVRASPVDAARASLADRFHLRGDGHQSAVLHYRTLPRAFNIAAADLSKMHRFASIRDKELRRRLTPDYDFGCKRPTFSNGYYRAFTKPHVHLQDAGIDHIEADGIVGNDGTKNVIDTLVLATGFDLWEANFPAIEVIGRDGRDLGKWWRDTRFQAYQGVSMPYFPNYLSLASPYAFLGLNFFNTMEYQMRLMDRLFTEVKRRGATTFEVTEEANTALPGPDDRAARRLAVHHRQLRDAHGRTTSTPRASPRCCGRRRRRPPSRKRRSFPLTDYQIA